MIIIILEREELNRKLCRLKVRLSWKFSKKFDRYTTVLFVSNKTKIFRFYTKKYQYIASIVFIFWMFLKFLKRVLFDFIGYC